MLAQIYMVPHEEIQENITCWNSVKELIDEKWVHMNMHFQFWLQTNLSISLQAYESSLSY